MRQNESELVARSMDGDEDAHVTLIDRYKKGLYRHCFKFTHDEDDAEDITLDAFVEAYVHLDRYDSRFRFSTWLYKIATNLALMHLRKRRDVPSAEDLALRNELRKAVKELPLRYRTVVAMHYWEGKSYGEIARYMGTSVGSVKGWMHRAKQQLKEILS